MKLFMYRQRITFIFYIEISLTKETIELHYTANKPILEVRTCRGRQANWTCGNVTFLSLME